MADGADVVIDKTSKRMLIQAHVGDDIRLPMRLRNKDVTDPLNPVYTDIDWATTQVETSLTDEAGGEVAGGMPYTTPSDGNLVIWITDTQTTAMGQGAFFGKLSLTEDDETVTRISFKFELTAPEDPY